MDFREVVSDALANLQSSIKRRRGSLAWDELPTVVGDRVQLVQLLQNLIGNAIMYRSEQPPRIHVDARRDGDCWEFSVQDNGIGIAPEHHQQMFEIFKRLHGRDKYPGTGIGLAVCKKIVQRHGGQISVDSQPEAGSVFRFTIRAATGEKASMNERALRRVGLTFSSSRTTKTTCCLPSTRSRRCPIAVNFHVARNGIEALAYLRQKPAHAGTPLPDIILLDLNMPRMDGRQLLAELKRDEHLKSIPTVILTTSSTEDDVHNAYRNHASAYMTKPIDVQEFARRTHCFADFWLSDVAILPSPFESGVSRA